jgi:four helix bundle protein
MATIQKFEDLRSWQMGRELVRTFHSIALKGPLCKDTVLHKQMHRAAISIVANLAEGFDRNGNKEFKQFAYIAKGSTAEFRALLYLALDLDYVTQDQFEQLNKRSVEIGKTIRGMISYLQNNPDRGVKAKESEEDYLNETIIAQDDFKLEL